MILVEDWAEIRRLHRAEQPTDPGNRAASGHLEEHGQACAGHGPAAEVRAPVSGVGRGRGRGPDP